MRVTASSPDHGAEAQLRVPHPKPRLEPAPWLFLYNDTCRYLAPVMVRMGKKLPVVTVRPQSLEEVVAFYRVEKQAEARRERESFAGDPTFEAAVRRAALALNADGSRHSHQRPFRVRQETLVLGRNGS